MPLAEARERFTRSEMVILSWRSQEQYWQMKSRLGEGTGRKKKPRKQYKSSSPYVSQRDAEELEKETGARITYEDPMLDNLPDRFFNAEGELDLSKVTGPEALKYMNMQSQAMGLPMFPVIGMPGGGRRG